MTIFKKIGQGLKSAWGGVVKLGHKAVSGAVRLGKKGVQAVVGGGLDYSAMDDEENLHAKMSQMGYGDKRKSSYQGYDLDNSLSDKRTAVYHNKNTKKTIISYRGTDPKDLDDLSADYHIVKGTHGQHNQFKNAVKTYDRVSSKYGKEGISLSGHSLGGKKAEYVNERRGGVKTHTYNQGQSYGSQEVAKSLKCKLPTAPKWCKTITKHHTKGDPISLLSRFTYGKSKSYKTKGLASHSIDNFVN